MNFSDRYAYLLHVLVAERILSDPKSVIEKARSNVKKWIGQTEHANAYNRSYFEWSDILDNNSPDEIRRLILRTDDEGQRLRSSTPFVGVLTDAERKAILKECEQSGAL